MKNLFLTFVMMFMVSFAYANTETEEIVSPIEPIALSSTTSKLQEELKCSSGTMCGNYYSACGTSDTDLAGQLVMLALLLCGTPPVVAP